jgi:NTP pyrophosphatase (non-canonical NTP hydrolase)
MKSIKQYSEEAISTAIYGKGSAIIYPTLGIAGEAGEIAEKVKKTLRDKNGEFTDEIKHDIALEIGDVMWYCNALARDIGYSLEEILDLNIIKLLSRRDRGVISGNGDNR